MISKIVKLVAKGGVEVDAVRKKYKDLVGMDDIFPET